MTSCDDKVTGIYRNMTIEVPSFGKRVGETAQPGRAGSPQAAVRLACNIQYPEGEYGIDVGFDGNHP